MKKNFPLAKTIVCLVGALLMMTSLAGCDTSQNISPNNNEKELKVVSTIYPPHDWIQQILGDEASRAELTLLADEGVDLHSYQPTVADIAALSTCDLFIYVGGTSDAWVEEALANAANEDMIVVNLLEVLGSAVKTEEVKEGMQHDHAQEGALDPHDYETETHTESAVLDEHVWLSLRNADTICAHLTEQLGLIDPDHALTYETNYAAYHKELVTLDESYQTTVDNAEHDTLIFGDRFPFRYLVDDYGISYYAAFAGCSSETEASFETIIFLSEKLEELGLSAIMVTESSDHAIAETILQNTADRDQSIYTLNSLQSTNTSNAETSYLSVMENNLKALKEALG